MRIHLRRCILTLHWQIEPPLEAQVAGMQTLESHLPIIRSGGLFSNNVLVSLDQWCQHILHITVYFFSGKIYLSRWTFRSPSKKITRKGAKERGKKMRLRSNYIGGKLQRGRRQVRARGQRPSSNSP